MADLRVRDLPDNLLVDLKVAAAQDHKTLTRLIFEILQAAMDKRNKR